MGSDTVDARVFALGFLREARRLPLERRKKIVDQLRSVESVSGESDLWLDLANALESMNEYNPFSASAKNVPEAAKAPVDAAVRQVKDTASSVSLAAANQLDRLYRATADQAKKVAEDLAAGAREAGWSLMPLAAVALILAWSWGRVTR